MPATCDLHGAKFGKLTVLKRAEKNEKNKSGGTYWQCLCECGNLKDIRSDCLRKRGFSHCGCESERIKVGDKFNMWTVISKSTKYQGRSNRWFCECECGNKRHVIATGLLRGESKSCGCRLNKYVCKLGKIGAIHMCLWRAIERGAVARGLEFNITPLYIWNLFLEQDSKCALSGIELTFTDTARNKKFATASLDRIDSSKGYIEGNVQWVHKHINIIKNSFSEEYLIELCRKIVKKADGES